jgi:hypothetical protein
MVVHSINYKSWLYTLSSMIQGVLRAHLSAAASAPRPHQHVDHAKHIHCRHCSTVSPAPYCSAHGSQSPHSAVLNSSRPTPSAPASAATSLSLSPSQSYRKTASVRLSPKLSCPSPSPSPSLSPPARPQAPAYMTSTISQPPAAEQASSNSQRSLSLSDSRSRAASLLQSSAAGMAAAICSYCCRSMDS